MRLVKQNCESQNEAPPFKPHILSAYPHLQTAVALTMLTDLSAPLPHDFSLDFQVDGFSVAEVGLPSFACAVTRLLCCGVSHIPFCAQGAGCIQVILDNSTSLSHHGNRIDVRPAHTLLCPACTLVILQLRGVPAGHHFLRAVLLDDRRIALKSCMAYVEAEFYVVSTTGPQQHPR